MYVERLELVDFRSYAEVTLPLGPGVHVLVGPNAQGKTNLLEALHYLAVGGSHRVSSDAPLVRAGAEAAVIRALVRLDSGRRRRLVEYELRPGGRNRARVDGQPQPRPRDAIGLLRSVMFAPEDLTLVRGDPGDRRRFLDELLGQRRPAYAAARLEYDRILKQRNSLLKQLRSRRRRGGPGGPEGPAAAGVADHQSDVLAVWTDALANTGATLLAARIAVVHALAGPADAAYRDLVAASPAREASGGVTLDYELSTGRVVRGAPGAGVPDPAELAAELRHGLAQRAEEEAERGMTLAGPHRDELAMSLNGLPAKGYASHGETWSLALALRLASREVLHEVGEEPVVLLDDVFAELDAARRARLAARCATFEQVLVSTALDADVPLRGPRHAVHAGTVRSAGGAVPVTERAGTEGRAVA